MLVLDVSQSAQRAGDQFAAWLPRLVGALVLLLIGWLIARAVAAAVRRGLKAVGLDRTLERGRAGDWKRQYAPQSQPSSLIARLVFWFLFALAIMAAVSALGVQSLTLFVAKVVAYLPNVIAAILILLIAIAISGAVGGLAQRFAGDTMLGRLVRTAVPAVIMTIALFMALVQLQIATQIVVATYVLVLGAIALGFALAFGLGGRDVARAILEDQYQSARAAMPQVREEAQVAKERLADKAQDLHDQAAPPEAPGSPGQAPA